MDAYQETEEYYWDQANSGYIVDLDFGDLTSEEFLLLNNYKCEIDFYEYMRIRDIVNYQFENIKNYYPKLEIFYKVKPDASREDIFFYLTRGYVKDDDKSTEEIVRLEKFYSLLPELRELLINNKEIEKTISDYDSQIIFDDSVIFASKKLGIDISKIEDVEERNYFFINELNKQFIHK